MRISRLLFVASVALICISSDVVHAQTPIVPPAPVHIPQASFWWFQFPSFAQINDNATFVKTLARLNINGPASDPTWGPYGQRLSELDHAKSFPELKATGARVACWIEGFGDCMIYAGAAERKPDGTFARRGDDLRLTSLCRTHWCWAVPELPKGNEFRWVGIHNATNDEDFVMPEYGHVARAIPVPTYPDGRSAVGWMDGVTYPLNARVYDACGSKDINGHLRPACEPPAKVNDRDPATGKPVGPIEGLYPAIIGKDDVPQLPGLKPGDTVYCGVLSVHKDLSAPFWREYARVSAREIIKHGLDGVWCDNYSPWDNFGYEPVKAAFGDWSVYRFEHGYLGNNRSMTAQMAQKEAREMAHEPWYQTRLQAQRLGVREYLKRKAVEFGAKDPSNVNDPAWHDPRWLDEPVWCAFKAHRQHDAQSDLAAFYYAIHGEADGAGKSDFCIGGNDIPFFGLGWVHDTYLDMVNTELTPGWHMGTGSRGILIPPVGKMAVVYRVALEHQKGPFSAAWYYLNQRFDKYQRKPEIGKLLCAEAFANGAFLMCDTNNKEVAGTLESHAWWNGFIRAHEQDFAPRPQAASRPPVGPRRPVADVGIVFSPDNQLFLMTPAGFPDMDRQPHIFGHYGWATALVDAHVPYRAITDWKLNADSLAGLRTLIVPDMRCLSAYPDGPLARWVRAGGRLVVTGETGTREGPGQEFRFRAKPALAEMLGVQAPPPKQPATVTRIGKGTVVWVWEPVGMDYYLQADKRAELRPGLLKLAGSSDLVDGALLPTTVGLSLWRTTDAKALFADLVNYDLDADADVVRPAEGLSFRLRLPGGWKAATVTTISPDEGATATAEVKAGWATVSVPWLWHYVSVKLARAGG